jgi:hypothetical protein
MNKKWEYTLRTIPRIDDIVFELDKLGNTGWELVHVSGTVFYFKRERQELSAQLENQEQDEVYGLRQA